MDSQGSVIMSGNTEVLLCAYSLLFLDSGPCLPPVHITEKQQKGRGDINQQENFCGM